MCNYILFNHDEFIFAICNIFSIRSMLFGETIEVYPFPIYFELSYAWKLNYRILTKFPLTNRCFYHYDKLSSKFGKFGKFGKTRQEKISRCSEFGMSGGKR